MTITPPGPAPHPGPVPTGQSPALRWGWPLTAGIFLTALAGIAASRGRAGPTELMVVAAALLSLVVVAVAQVRSEHRRWFALIHGVVDQIDGLAADPSRPLTAPGVPELAELAQAVETLRLRLVAPADPPAAAIASSAEFPCLTPSGRIDGLALTRSGLFEPAASHDGIPVDLLASGEFGVGDMICRLEPRSLRWLGASPACAHFLGFAIEELRLKSFLEVVHPDHRELAREQLHACLARGEGHGLIYRIRTGRDESKAVEMNVGVRYGPDMTVTHLRAHLTDVTDRLRAGKELRRRTRELTLANQQLRAINRELEELKDTYGDLYQNAPAMYLTLDDSGIIRDCNNRMLRELGHRREDLIGRHCCALLDESWEVDFRARFRALAESGHLEMEGRWRRADGSPMDVFLTASVAHDPEGSGHLCRVVAQDISARRALEAKLREKHDRLERVVDELSRKNRELDEFTYVVSHDLQEPIRTLIAFSGFLVSDSGEKLDEVGREHLKFIVDASLRMRTLIRDLLTLGRAGRVAGEPTSVDLSALIATIQADMSALIAGRGATIAVEGPLPTLWGDRDRLGQLFANLITNGLKYNRRDRPTVTIGVADEAATATTSQPATATVFVRDDGIGIDPKFFDKIFQMFRRLHTREEYEGTGAGLAICQKVAHAHGGRIWVESAPGGGSTFYVSIPRPPRPPAAVAAPSPPATARPRELADAQ